MGNIINKFVFMPPGREVYIAPDDIFLETKHGSRIHTKFINRNAKFTFVISHSNAEDIEGVFAWASSKLLTYCDVNIFMYGK